MEVETARADCCALFLLSSSQLLQELKLNIHSLNIDPVNETTQLTFNDQNNSVVGSVTFKLPIAKHETMEHVEKAAKHKLAEMLEAAAKALREHQ